MLSPVVLHGEDAFLINQERLRKGFSLPPKGRRYFSFAVQVPFKKEKERVRTQVFGHCNYWTQGVEISSLVHVCFFSRFSDMCFKDKKGCCMSIAVGDAMHRYQDLGLHESEFLNFLNKQVPPPIV